MENQRKLVYHGEKCKGMVTTDFFVDGKTVEGYFCDGDISSDSVRWYIEKTGKNEYKIIKTDQLYTPLDVSWGKNCPERKSKKVNVETEKEDLVAMIDFIVEPYKNPGPYPMPVNAEELKESLEKALLN